MNSPFTVMITRIPSNPIPSKSYFLILYFLKDLPKLYSHLEYYIKLCSFVFNRETYREKQRGTK